MLDTVKKLILSQFEAALCTLHLCIERCPEPDWNKPVGTKPFCQAAFHTLFFADYYLGQNESSYRDQPFHRQHPDFFRDYEELEDRKPLLLYDRPTIRLYVQHCREKASRVIAGETEASLRARAEFTRRTFSRAELHVYNLRHIQHHAAQMSLRLRINHGIDIPWVGIGWREASK
jgi:hypothetical protein